MSKHLFGMMLTHEGTFANNRGESEGTATTLQKVLRDGELFSTVSAEAMRYALREMWQERRLELNRTIKPQDANGDGYHLAFEDRSFEDWHQKVDDDLLGFMRADQGISRRSVVELTRAISVTPWRGELMHNFASPGSNPSPGAGQENPIPYAVEVHHTRYQYGFAITPAAIGRKGLPPNATEHLEAEQKKQRLTWALEGLASLRRVGGNHARYLADYSPEALVLRWTDDPAPRFLYCFEQDEHGTLNVQRLVERTGEGDADIHAEELIIGTPLDVAGMETLEKLGACRTAGIKQGVSEALNRITESDLMESAED